MCDNIEIKRDKGTVLQDEKNELHNRSMHISGMLVEADIESSKENIGDTEADMEKENTGFNTSRY